MKISRGKYKDIGGIILEYGAYRITVLPSQGGKVASFKKEGKEYLAQREGERYRKLTLDSSYIESECSAFDDMFPTIDPCSNGFRDYLDHGEVCRIPHDYQIRDKSLYLEAKSPFNDYIFCKEFYLDEDGTLIISYSAENLLDRPLPVLWAAHLMLKAYDGMQALLPEGNYSSKMIFSSIDYENMPLKSDFSKNDSYKFYIKEEINGPVSYNNFFVETRNVPYLGIWINNGEFNNMTNYALEFATGLYDKPQKGQEVIIEPKDTINWQLKIYIGGDDK